MVETRLRTGARLASESMTSSLKTSAAIPLRLWYRNSHSAGLVLNASRGTSEHSH